MPHRLVLLLLALCLYSATALAVLPPSEQIRTFLEGLDAGAEPFVGERRLHNPGLLSSLYSDRNHAPIWIADGPLADSRSELLRAVEVSAAHGLNPGDYHDQALRAVAGRVTTEGDGTGKALALELLASDAFLQQVRHRSSGAVSPRELDPDWHLIPPEVDPVQTLAGLAEEGGSPVRTLDALWPVHDEYQQLLDERARILALGEIHVEPVPPGPLLKPGRQSSRRCLLERLKPGGSYC